MAGKKEELVNFLKSRVFDPVLKAKPDDYTGHDRDKLKHVQEATRSEIDRFHDYGSAEDVVVNFKRDLHSEHAKKIHRESRDLNLPTLNDVREDFENKAKDLGVKA